MCYQANRTENSAYPAANCQMLVTKILLYIFQLSRNLPCFADSMYNFQSPNYPQSLGNESYMCTLKIHHTPTLEELIAAANVRS